MLSSLELENFKAFGKRTTIPLRPITLIFGENSAGKSSILQALNLLKQTREAREAGALLLPRAERGIVDLGSFQEMLFDHDLSRTLSFRLQMNSDRRTYRLFRHAFGEMDIATYGLEVEFMRPSLEEEVRLRKCTLFTNGSPIASFQGERDFPRPLRRFIGPMYRERRDRLADLKGAKCSWITDDETFWTPFYELSLEYRDELLSELNRRLENISSSKADDEQPDLFEFDEDVPSTVQAIKDAINFYGREFDLDQYIARMRAAQRMTYIGLDGFLPVASYIDEQHLPEYDLRWHRMQTEVLPDTGRLAFIVGRELEITLEGLFPLGPFRTPPARWYIFTGTSPQDVGYEGELLPDFLSRQPGVLQKTNEWLDRLNVGYQLQVVPAGARLRDLFEVRLEDMRRKRPVDVSLSDVGFGISQILPFIVQSLAAEDQILSIEQPEVHIHPRLQADLGDLLAEAIKPPRRNQFIIETHSEHLILRLQRLVREGTLKPEDISVIYVSRGAEGSDVERLRLDDDGDFVDDWPGGFFPERLRELI